MGNTKKLNDENSGIFFHLEHEYWVDLTRNSPCLDAGCDGGGLVWEDDGTNFVFADSNLSMVQADQAADECLRYREINKDKQMTPGFFDQPCDVTYHVMCTGTCD